MQYEMPHTYIPRVVAQADAYYAAVRANDAAKRAAKRARVAAAKRDRVAPVPRATKPERKHVARGRVVEITTETYSTEHTSKSGAKWYRELERPRAKPIFEAWYGDQLLETDFLTPEAARECINDWIKTH